MRPSSTAAVGYIFIPIYALIIGLIGAGLGKIIKYLLKSLPEEQDQVSYIKHLTISAIITGFLIVLVSSTAQQQIKDYEKRNIPHLISTNKTFKKIDINKTTLTNDIK